MKHIKDYIEPKVSIGTIIVFIGLVGTFFVRANQVTENEKVNYKQDVKIDTLVRRANWKDRQMDVIIEKMNTQQSTLNEIRIELKELRKELK